MGKKKNQRFPDCCIEAKAFDASFGDAIVAMLIRRPDEKYNSHFMHPHLRSELKFKLCPYCGRKMKKEKEHA